MVLSITDTLIDGLNGIFSEERNHLFLENYRSFNLKTTKLLFKFPVDMATCTCQLPRF